MTRYTVEVRYETTVTEVVEAATEETLLKYLENKYEHLVWALITEVAVVTPMSRVLYRRD